MNPLSQVRCLNHAGREAAARCPECGQYFCRECITEHHHRVMCAKCLARLAAQGARHRRQWVGVGAVAQALVGFFLLWMLLLGLGRLLLLIPSSFHEGAIWETSSLLEDE